jgi:hypothetical protein
VRFAGLAALCATALVAPALLLVWMPLLVGVPHVASDIRYLVLPLPRAQIALAIAASLTLVVLRAASIATGMNLLMAEATLVAGWLLASLVLEPTARKRALGIALFASAVIIGLPIVFIATAALAHNFLAIVAWVVVARPTKKHALTLVGGVALFALIAGLVGPLTSALTGGDASPWLTLDKAAGVMFGGLPHGVARGLLIAFAFLQGVHYTIWLGWIPASQPAPKRGIATVAIAAATLTVLAGALYNPAWARTTYLALATFHIYLEIVILAARWSRRKEVTP